MFKYLLNLLLFMVKKQGDHLKQSETKSYLLQYILEKNVSVSEPDIRHYLKQKYDLIDQSTINRHLHDLEDEGCIKLIPPDKKGLRNKWDITKPKHLENISDKFSEIQLNKYEKSKIIILHEYGYDIKSLTGLQFYIRLLLSASFFDMCIKTNIETIFSRAWKIYLYDKGFGDNQRIKELLNEFYILYIKDNPNFDMSYEIFQQMIEELAQKKAEISDDTFSKIWEEKFHGLYKEMSREVFIIIKEELVQRIDRLMEGVPRTELVYKTFEEKYPELSREHVKGILIDKVYYEILKEESRRSKGYENSVENSWKTIVEDREMHTKMERIFELIELQRSDFKRSRFDLLLEHFLKHDVLTGGDSPDELEFAKKLKENEAMRDVLFVELKDPKDREEAIVKWFLNDLKYESEIIFKFKQPSIFSNNCNTSDEVYQRLIDFFGFRSLIE
jgi:Fe2+ or Zn2+ uptake regulation protein